MRYQLFPNLTADEFEALTADIQARGVMVPVEIDEQGAILDGHHRVMIADSLGVDYPKVVRSGWTEEQKLVHISALNLARRHLSSAQWDELTAEMRRAGMSIRSIAEAQHRPVGTVQHSVERVSVDTPAVTGRDGKSYQPLRPRPETDGSAALAPEPWQPSPALMSSDSPDWYTPKRVIAAVVKAMGGIDLDPCAESAKSVPAKLHYTEADDGLSRAWAGRVYMNPPYGRSIGVWITKLSAEYRVGLVTEAIALIPARIETDWFYALDAVWFCNIEGRLAFSDHDTAAPFPSVAVYLGSEGNGFGDAFVSLGDVYERRWRYNR